MAITIEVYQVEVETDENDVKIYTAYLKFIDNGKVIKNKSVSAKNMTEFKDRIRLFKEKIDQAETERLTLITMVQNAINEVMAEE